MITSANVRELTFHPLSRPTSTPGLHVLVDLSVLHPHGENGGLKQYLLELLRYLGTNVSEPIRFTYLVSPLFHPQLRALWRPRDRIVSIRPVGDALGDLPGTWRTGDHLLAPAPLDLALQIAADVVYAPMLSLEFGCPGVPMVALIPDLLHRDMPDSCGAEESARREAHFAEIAQVANRIQCISRFTADRLHHHYPASRGRTFFTHLAVHDRWGDIEKRPVGLSDGPYFFYPANAWIHKNHSRLLAAYRAYRGIAVSPPWSLVLTGHMDPGMKRVLRTAQSLGIGDFVKYIGYLSASEMAYVWRHAGALVFPSRYEGFGMPLTEAMHYGVPIVCNGEGAVPEVVDDAALQINANEAGELAQAMDRIATDPELRTVLAERGRRRVGSFSIAKDGDALLEALISAAGEPAQPYCRGIGRDGRVDRQFVAGLPDCGQTRVVEMVLSSKRPSRISLFQDLQPLGSFPIAEGERLPLTCLVGPQTHSLVGWTRPEDGIKIHRIGARIRSAGPEIQAIFEAA